MSVCHVLLVEPHVQGIKGISNERGFLATRKQWSYAPDNKLATQ